MDRQVFGLVVLIAFIWSALYFAATWSHIEDPGRIDPARPVPQVDPAVVAARKALPTQPSQSYDHPQMPLINNRHPMQPLVEPRPWPNQRPDDPPPPARPGDAFPVISFGFDFGADAIAGIKWTQDGLRELLNDRLRTTSTFDRVWRPALGGETPALVPADVYRPLGLVVEWESAGDGRDGRAASIWFEAFATGLPGSAALDATLGLRLQDGHERAIELLENRGIALQFEANADDPGGLVIRFVTANSEVWLVYSSTGLYRVILRPSWF